MKQKQPKKYKNIGELGEFGLIDHLTKSIKIINDETVKGIGDDAAVVHYPFKNTVITTDLLIEGVHFDLAYTPLKHLGYKSVIVNLSDVFAMNAFPKQITVSIAVSNRFPVEALEELYSGIQLACNNYKIDLIGGDTTSSLKGMMISITAIGANDNEKLVYRNGAKVNDLICVTGDLGAAYSGLQIMEREKHVFLQNPEIQPDLSSYNYLIERQLKPEARMDIINFFDKNTIVPTSMIDISDGLSSELIHITKQSQVGCEIYESKIPIAQETSEAIKEMNQEPVLAALNGGEDYELLFTIPEDEYHMINKNKAIHVIGKITEKNCTLVVKDGSRIELKAQGWNPIAE